MGLPRFLQGVCSQMGPRKIPLLLGGPTGRRPRRRQPTILEGLGVFLKALGVIFGQLGCRIGSLGTKLAPRWAKMRPKRGFSNQSPTAGRSTDGAWVEHGPPRGRGFATWIRALPCGQAKRV